MLIVNDFLHKITNEKYLFGKSRNSCKPKEYENVSKEYFISWHCIWQKVEPCHHLPLTYFQLSIWIHIRINYKRLKVNHFTFILRAKNEPPKIMFFLLWFYFLLLSLKRGILMVCIANKNSYLKSQSDINIHEILYCVHQFSILKKDTQKKKKDWKR